ncbi:double-strand break repair helicase AddA [Erythrobacter sp. JK5]|uniref:double-strand break repair helicase AddA n=1 Tax=Erythrobacter sp. JK5 TaxID=2829500 RepID=UPI001BA5EF81|nr:double-strand break repair helicase AddA [Erythrobacter sp. JK5]QUL38903.1 double-strand break repair helicase AddA [Erythrobacter sp. JK5]
MSSSGSGLVFPLEGNQRRAVDPRDNVWLSASAGTGKTQVLSARVLRLLLRPDVKPSEILCLTFTKAGAAEMANRINAVLARWVRLDDTKLFRELGDLGAEQTDAVRERARTLFASVLDCPGGGLRIDTIHAFSQWLLANFPEEADLMPGARPMEDRERELLAREVLADMLDDADTRGDAAVLDAVEMFTTRKEPGALRGWLMRCASQAEMWEGTGAWQPPMRPRVHTLLEMPADADDNWASRLLEPATFPDHQLQAMIGPLEEWGKKDGLKALAAIREWLAIGKADRSQGLPCLLGTVLNADGLPNGKIRFVTKHDPEFINRQQEVAEAVAIYSEHQALLDLADLLTHALELGRAFWLRWEEAKRRDGLLDFNDLIRKAAALLNGSIASDWIRYKLDRQFDHILIDEAQDTNRAQWDIVDALIDDFFSGEGAAGDKLRTIFTVGDYKQAIFGFQGTSPENYERAKIKIRQRIMDARENASQLRANRLIPNWEELDLGRSFRTSQPVLAFVNRAIETLGHDAFGLPDPPAPHEGDERAGLVTLWTPVTAETLDPEEDEAQERDWLPAHETVLAGKIAEQVQRWVEGEERFVLEKGGRRRHAAPGDIMVLVRKRGALAAQIVAQLHARKVPVAGVDRLRLGAPLAVQDLMAALRFAAQPLDDLSLANLLGSPLIGWSQDDLLEYVPRGRDVRLWNHLRDHAAPFVRETCARLGQLLARADFETPQALLAWLLTGPWQGRRRLVSRLGREANDPIDELVNTAFAYQSAHVPSLAAFIEWFDASSEELKRDADDAGGQVRVMTVHGSKGLQAPIVILADATGKPGDPGDLELGETPLGEATPEQERRKVPLPSVKKEERAGPVKTAAEAKAASAMQEHWRLLYVAMTRAEEALFIGGSLGKRDLKNGPHEDSWYARLEPLFGDELADPIWGARREIGRRADPLSGEDAQTLSETGPDLPRWVTAPIGPEPRPPRPLAPSAAGEDQGADPPLAPELVQQAARRGVLVHRLLERLPDVPRETRAEVARTWLDRQGGAFDADARAEMLASALAVLDHPGFAVIFSPDALAEVPLAATVDGMVVAGTVDRLLVTSDAVTVVDFKTSRRPPRRQEDIPPAALRQMAAYVAALGVIYPGRAIRAAILYTQTPCLFEISPDRLAPHKQRLGETQESYAPLDIE